VAGSAPLPTESPIGVVHMGVGFGNKQAYGNFIVDTGAAISFISSDMAKAIGLDSNGDGELGSGDDQFQDTLPIGGIGGTIDAPVFSIDRMTVPTEQGVDLVWNQESLTSVIIVDLGLGIDGVLGSDLLTSGWLGGLFSEDGGQTVGPVEMAHLDFRNFHEEGDLGKLNFDLSPSFDVVHPGMLAGDYNGDGVVDAADYTVWRDTFGSTTSLAADGNHDSKIDQGDYDFWKSRFGATMGAGSGAAVPEPATFTLLAVAAAIFGCRRRIKPRG
jgi:hypothetical protein